MSKNPNNENIQSLSADELFELLNNGGSINGIQQITTDADGNQYTSNVYGSFPNDDGIDRSVNIFSDLGDFIKYLGNPALEHHEDNIVIPEDFSERKGYEVTFDCMNIACTMVLTVTENKTRLVQYVRDERKSNSTVIKESEWDINKGQFDISVEAIKDDNNIAIAHTMIYARKYLKDNNLLDELIKLDNKSSGVIFSYHDDKISARIVRGVQRPDLPCDVFMFGEQMWRPYQDELLLFGNTDEPSLDNLIAGAEDGDVRSMTLLAMAYLNGNEETEPNPEKSFYWFEKAAEQDEEEAQFNTGLFYAKGHGTKRDFEKAAYWMKRAAENGDEDAEPLADEYSRVSSLKMKADSGDAQAQFEMAGILTNLAGSLDQAGPGEDYKLALEYAKKSAAQNNGDGYWALALAYEHGRGVEMDESKAIELFTKGANLGSARCMQNLGCYYLRGDYVETDTKRGFELVLKSAELGNSLAAFNVGFCYHKGNGTVRNYELAREWYNKALELGETDADVWHALERLDEEENAELEWLEEYGEYITKNPKIEFNNKLFVFTGVDNNFRGPDDNTDFMDIFTKKGGVVRTAVSGKTDYLVCNPLWAGGSKIEAAINQKKNGKNIQIVLFADFLNALYGNTNTTSQEQPTSNNTPKAQKESVKHETKKVAEKFVGKKIAGRNERIVVNDDFSIIVPENYSYSLDKSIIRVNRALVFIKTEENNYFNENWGEDYSLGDPFGAPRCLTVVPTQQFSPALNLEDKETRSIQKKLISSLAVALGNVTDSETDVITIKETKDVLVYIVKFGEASDTSIYIITPTMFYTGQIWICDIEPDEDILLKIASDWLNTIEAKDFSGDPNSHSLSPEEKKRAEDDKKAREAEEKRLKEERDALLKSREAFIKENTKKEEEKYSKEFDTLYKEYEKEYNPLKDKMKQNESLINSKNKELQSLGMFSIFKKKDCRNTIAELEAENQEIKSKISVLNEQHSSKCNVLNTNKNNAISEINFKAAKKYTLPEEKGLSDEELRMSENERIKYLIVNRILDYRTPMTAKDITEEVQKTYPDVSLIKVNALMRQLNCDAIRVNRKDVGTTSYFTLA